MGGASRRTATGSLALISACDGCPGHRTKTAASEQKIQITHDCVSHRGYGRVGIGSRRRRVGQESFSKATREAIPTLP